MRPPVPHRDTRPVAAVVSRSKGGADRTAMADRGEATRKEAVRHPGAGSSGPVADPSASRWTHISSLHPGAASHAGIRKSWERSRDWALGTAV